MNQKKNKMKHGGNTQKHAGKAAKNRNPDPVHSMELDECVFANPALEQAKALKGPTDSDSLDDLIAHSELVNEMFYTCVSEWTTEKMDSQDVFDKGMEVGKAHIPFFESLMDDDDTKKAELICGLASTLISQMEDTCHYDEWKHAYASVSTIMMDGFAAGVGFEDGCGDSDDSEWEGDEY